MIRRSTNYAMIGGVCSGYAICEKKPLALIRTVAVLAFIATGGLATMLYLAAWIVMPKTKDGESNSWDKLSPQSEMVRKKSNRVIGGVCGAFADYFKIDATVVRVIAAVLLLSAGIGFFTYLFAWAIIPEET